MPDDETVSQPADGAGRAAGRTAPAKPPIRSEPPPKKGWFERRKARSKIALNPATQAFRFPDILIAFAALWPALIVAYYWLNAAFQDLHDTETLTPLRQILHDPGLIPHAPRFALGFVLTFLLANWIAWKRPTIHLGAVVIAGIFQWGALSLSGGLDVAAIAQSFAFCAVNCVAFLPMLGTGARKAP